MSELSVEASIGSVDYLVHFTDGVHQWRADEPVTTVRQVFRGDMFDMVAHFEPSIG